MAVDYLGGEQSPVLKKTPIASASLKQGNKMDGLTGAPFTMMCSNLMVRPGLDRSTCCQQASLVRPSAWLVSDLQAMIPETVGPPPSESYARWDAHSCGWKTSQASLLDLMGISEPSSVNFTKAGMMRSGELSALPQLVHPINETGFGSSRTNQTLWPTPTVNGNNNHKGASKKAGDGLRTAVVLDAMGFWPRPETQNPSMKGFEVGNTCTVILDSQPWDSMYARGIIWGINGEMIDVQMECGQIECWPRENVIPTGLPTPTKNDAKNTGSASRHARNSVPLDGQVHGPLNPEWTAWLMGWPIGATALAFMETDRCPNKWWRPLSPCSTRQLDTCTTETSDG